MSGNLQTEEAALTLFSVQYLCSCDQTLDGDQRLGLENYDTEAAIYLTPMSTVTQSDNGLLASYM